VINKVSQAIAPEKCSVFSEGMDRIISYSQKVFCNEILRKFLLK
jgi:hypothetical protein